MLSTSPVGQPPASTPLVAVMDRVDQMIVVVQNEVSSIARTIAQEIVQELAYLEMQLNHIFGIDTDSQNPSLNSSMRPTGNGLGNIVTMASNASNQVSNNGAPQAGNGSGNGSSTIIKPQDSPGGPDLAGAGDYTWNPTAGNNASNPANWLVNEGPNRNNTIPGDNPGDTVTFDPGDPNAPNGAQPITWDYPAKFSSMNIGGENGQVYNNVQTIAANVKTIELTGGSGTSLTMAQPSGALVLQFNGISTFQIDNNATITNMNLIGKGFGTFLINGGITTMAQSSSYNETLQVQFTIAKGATVNDMSYTPLQFTDSLDTINVNGTMLVYYGNAKTNTLISNVPGTDDDLINVSGGTLKYAGNGGVTDTFTVPVLVQNGGDFYVTSAPNRNPSGTLIVQGTVPNMVNKASVYMTGGTGISTIQLSQGATLDAVNGYFQDSGMLETTDKSTCNLQIGTNGNLGTANVAGGVVWIDTQAGTFGTLDVVGSMNFNGQLVVSVQGYPYDPANPQEGTSRDQLYVPGTLTLNKAASTLTVYTYGGLVQNDYWRVIQSPKNAIAGDFSSEKSVPAGANMTYGPPNNPDNGYYRVTFNG